MLLKRAKENIMGILGVSWSLFKADFSIKNQGTYLGVFWYLLEPVLIYLAILIIRPIYVQVPGENYPIYLLVGLIMYNFFVQSTNSSLNIIEKNKKFIKNIKFPYESLILSSFALILFAHLFEIIILGFVMNYFGLSFFRLGYYLIVLVFFALFCLGLSFILSIAGFYLKDFVIFWKGFVRALFFATPIFYFVSESNSYLFNYNFLNYFLDLARNGIMAGNIISWAELGWGIGLSLFSLFIGWLFFNFIKNKFPERSI